MTIGLAIIAILASIPVSSDKTSEIQPENFINHVTYLSTHFNTRNTSSPELIEAAGWVKNEFEKIPGLKVELFPYTVHKGPRVPETKEVVEVVATLPGEDDQRIIVGGHLDSINIHEDALTGRAPGADDDLSGVALTLEAARLMAQFKWKHTLQFVAFSGEEQGLFGSAALAKHAKENNWKIDAVFSNDTVGSIKNVAGEKDAHHVRIFSDDQPSTNSRELARFVAWLSATAGNHDGLMFDPSTDRTLNHHPDFGVKMVLRLDRFGRGGDHYSFNKEGFDAIRFIEVCEDTTRQHTPTDTVDQIDKDYLRHVTALNILAMSAIGNAASAPLDVKIKRDQSRSTTIHWTGDPNQDYMVYWRDTASAVYTGWMRVHGLEAVVTGVNKDDNTFAVGAIGGVPLEAK